MGWYYDAKPTIETDEGIKAKSRRGKFVEKWWATRWIEAMEAVMDPRRLQRGRRYARKGQVLSLAVADGTVVAQVLGSRPTPYRVEMQLKPLPDAAWEKAIERLTERPYLVAQLLAGEVPPEIEEIFEAAEVALFPEGRELLQECSCPDWSRMCKHQAAAHYILGERLDENPFLLFELRGRSRDDIIAALEPVAGRGAEAVPPAYQPAPPLGDELDNFWRTGPELEALTFHLEPPDFPYPLLERLGTPDFLPEAGNWLRRAYERVTERALAVAYEEESEDAR